MNLSLLVKSLSIIIIWFFLVAVESNDSLDFQLFKLKRELKRVEILLNKTREDYAKRTDVVNSINRLEEKIDRILERLK